MAWTSAHFAVGMAVGGGATTAIGLCYPRALRAMAPVMTLTGLWAIVPDLPRLWREDFPSLPFSAVFGQRALEKWLHGVGDVFFFHRAMDAQPREFALHGLLAIVAMYNAAFLAGVIGRWFEHRGRPRWRTGAVRHDRPIDSGPTTQPSTHATMRAGDVVNKAKERQHESELHLDARPDARGAARGGAHRRPARPEHRRRC